MGRAYHLWLVCALALLGFASPTHESKRAGKAHMMSLGARESEQRKSDLDASNMIQIADVDMDCATLTNTTFYNLFKQPGCEALITEITLIGTDKENIKSVCNSPCFNQTLEGILVLNEKMCLEQPRATFLAGLCNQNVSLILPDVRLFSPMPSASPSPYPSHSVQPSEIVPECVNKCSNHGTCMPLPEDRTKGVCVCNKGYGWQGLLDITNLPLATMDKSEDCSEFTLAKCPDLCNGHGVCVNKDSPTCKCLDGFDAKPTCDVSSGCQDLAYCSGHGTCMRPDKGPLYCVCLGGFTGEFCATIDMNCPNSCSGHGHCTLTKTDKYCECDENWAGSECNVPTGPHCENQCSGMGKCVAEDVCECIDGRTGTDCTEVIDPCDGCQHGLCNHVTKSCVCSTGYQGRHCEVYNATLDTECAKLNFCSGSGVCQPTVEEDGTHSAVCTCFKGFSGTICNVVEAGEDCLNYCSGHGTCLVDGPRCDCQTLWYGEDCSISRCPTNNGKVCSGHGICDRISLHNLTDSFECTCDFGYENGQLGACENLTIYCSNNCSGHGECIGKNECKCFGYYTGDNCSIPLTPHSKLNQVLSAEPAEEIVSAPAQTEAAKKKHHRRHNRRHSSGHHAKDHRAHGRSQSVAARDDEESSPIMDLSMCLNSCHRRGDCVLGKCECHSGYTGDDCSKELPALYEESGEVDLLELGSNDQNSHKPSMVHLWD